jgi:hypothetical protein
MSYEISVSRHDFTACGKTQFQAVSYQGTASQAAEKVENSATRMTLNASNFRKNAHIEFKREAFSSISEISHFSAACSVVPIGPLFLSSRAEGTK